MNFNTFFIYLEEFFLRFFQVLVSGAFFDFPPLLNLRNLVYHFLFLTDVGFSVGRNCNFIRANFIDDNKNLGKLKVGKNVIINHDVEIDYSGGITIEDEVWISQNVIIETHSHVPSFKFKKKWPIRRSNLKIRNDAWIGANVVIMETVRYIGLGSVIGAGSIVTKDVPDGVIYAGIPAKHIKNRSSKI